MEKLLSSCFLTWPIYLSSEPAQNLTSRCDLQNSLVLPVFLDVTTLFAGVVCGLSWGLVTATSGSFSVERSNA